MWNIITICSLVAILAILKFAGIFAGSWLLVFAPLWGTAIVMLISFGVISVIRRFLTNNKKKR